ncbi:hypothetical protein DFH09DRAFT_1092017 [Mycena vulgaris]|nr:hypothetical protein DFH09DRAFT_1092017 [Mycena vulgaris]
MAVPIQQLAVQLASGSLNTIAVGPPPNLGGTPQWALDMIHENKWEFYVMKIMNYNSSVDLQEQVAWSLARNQKNATLNHDVLHLAPLYLPLPRLAVPAILAPPAPGAPANPPPFFVLPGPGPAPAAHASFPVTRGDLRTLTPHPFCDAVVDLALLFPAYNLPQPNGLVAVQRAEFARPVGDPRPRLSVHLQAPNLETPAQRMACVSEHAVHALGCLTAADVNTAEPAGCYPVSLAVSVSASDHAVGLEASERGNMPLKKGWIELKPFF